MAKKSDSEIEKKLKYIGLDLDNIPRNVSEFEPLKYIAIKGYEENQYKQYRYIPTKNIQILLTPTNRMDEIEKKYRKASPLCDYLDNKSERNLLKHTKFLKMLKDVNIDEIQNIEREQIWNFKMN